MINLLPAVSEKVAAQAVDFETETRSRYWDFEPYRREYQEAFFQRVI